MSDLPSAMRRARPGNFPKKEQTDGLLTQSPPTLHLPSDHQDPAPLTSVLSRRRVIAAAAGVVGMAALSRFPRATAAPVVRNG